MTGFLYKSYCYETVSQVAASVHSSFYLDGFGVIQSVSYAGSDLTVNYLNSSLTPLSFSYPLTTCEKLGFDNNFSGLSQDDSLHLAESVVGVLIAAWAIKIVKRAL